MVFVRISPVTSMLIRGSKYAILVHRGAEFGEECNEFLFLPGSTEQSVADLRLFSIFKFVDLMTRKHIFPITVSLKLMVL